MGNKKDRLGGRYGGEPEKAIANPGNLDVDNPVEEATGPHNQTQYSADKLHKASVYIKTLRNPLKKKYAEKWFSYRLSPNRTNSPDVPSLSYMAKQAVRMNIDDILGEGIYSYQGTEYGEDMDKKTDPTVGMENRSNPTHMQSEKGGPTINTPWTAKPRSKHYKPDLTDHWKDRPEVEGDSQDVEESKMPKLKEIVRGLVKEDPDGKEPSWAQVYRKNTYDRSKEICDMMNVIQKITGRKPLPGKSWQLDDYEIDQILKKHIPNAQDSLRRIAQSLEKYKRESSR